MDILDFDLDWAFVPSFLAVAETGSLSAAARQTGQSQPTVGRHIKALEAQLGVELFRRIPKGLELTEAGMDILTYAREMKQAAARLRLAAEGRDEEASGTVRITASVVTSYFTLPPIIAKMRRDWPQIAIELVPSDTTENLIFREADIAVRMYRPTQPDVIARQLGERRIGLYAARAYLERAGRPRDLEELLQLDFVGYDRNDTIIHTMADMGVDVSREFFPVRCDDQAAHWNLVRAGCGVGGMQMVIGDADPLLEQVMPEIELPTLPIWLVAPDALRTNARIRKVWDGLARALA